MVAELTNRATIHLISNPDSTTLKDLHINESYSSIAKGIANGNSTPSNDPHIDESPTSIVEGAYNLNTLSRYTSAQFYGILIDTGAARHPTAGYGPFQALPRADAETHINELSTGMVTVQLRIGSTASVGSTTIRTPVGIVRFHVVDADTPFLLRLADLDERGVYFNHFKNTLVTSSGNVPVVRRFGHPFLLWNSCLHALQNLLTTILAT